jgi:hypothetical protein
LEHAVGSDEMEQAPVFGLQQAPEAQAATGVQATAEQVPARLHSGSVAQT